MRFVWAVVAFVLATILIGAGIAQRTIFMGPSSQQLELQIEQPEPYILMDGDVLRTNPGAQLLVRGDGEIFAAYGRTADLQAWLSDASYTSVTLAEDGTPQVEMIEPTVTPVDEDSAEGDASGDAADEGLLGRNPAGSDLWLDSFSEKDQLIADLALTEGMSVLIAKDGTLAAPDDVVVSWPLDTSTPMAGPLMTAGAVVLLVGLVLYGLGIRYQRRGRGPLRKGPGPLPPTEPIDIAELPSRQREAIAPTPVAGAPEDVVEGEIIEQDTEDATDGNPRQTSMRARPRARRLLVLPGLALTAILAAGCSADSWPQFGAATPSPSPTATVITPENQKPPAVTEAQASRILLATSTTLETADADLDLDLASTRLTGAPLAARTTDYALRQALSDSPLPAILPTDKLEVVLPQATDTWPRTVLLLSKSTADESVPPVIVTMVQEDPWTNYKVTNMAEMQASAQLPEIPAKWLGTSPVPAESAFLSLPPGELAAAFASVVDEGEKSESYGLFDELTQNLVASIAESRQSVVQNLIDNGARETSAVSFDIAPAANAPVSFTTLDSGAIVAVSLVDTERVTPSTPDALIKFGENEQAKALTGATESAKGVETTYGFQLFFAVPAQSSTDPIRLLAVHQDLLDVKVIK